MGIVIGIDVGISTTKIVGISEKGEIISPIRIKATDPVASLYGAFGRYLHDNGINLSDVRQVMLTGVGSAYIEDPIYGLPTEKVQEFMADGLGARFETRLDRMLVVSMGTGTSFVRCDGDSIRHIGGIGVGGGTLQGLARIMLKTGDIAQVVELSKGGDLSRINVLIGDISPRPLPGLPSDAIASLFGNAQSDATREDIALGILWTVLQSICSAAILSSMDCGIKDFVMIGKLSMLPLCEQVFAACESLYAVAHMARSAAFNDSRFAPLASVEVPQVEIEISVLSPLKRIGSAGELKLGRDGIYMVKGGKSGTFLPQVAMETGWSKEEFLGHCARDKAGIGWDGWKTAELYTYQAVVFKEN